MKIQKYRKMGTSIEDIGFILPRGFMTNTDKDLLKHFHYYAYDELYKDVARGVNRGTTGDICGVIGRCILDIIYPYEELTID